MDFEIKQLRKLTIECLNAYTIQQINNNKLFIFNH